MINLMSVHVSHISLLARLRMPLASHLAGLPARRQVWHLCSDPEPETRSTPRDSTRLFVELAGGP